MAKKKPSVESVEPVAAEPRPLFVVVKYRGLLPHAAAVKIREEVKKVLGEQSVDVPVLVIDEKFDIEAVRDPDVVAAAKAADVTGDA